MLNGKKSGNWWVRGIVLTFLSIYFNSGFSQNQNRAAWISLTDNDTLQVDTLSIVPGQLHLYTNFGHLIPDSCYKVNYISAVLILKRKSLESTFSYPVSGIKVFYKTFPVNLNQPHFHKDVKLIRPGLPGQQNPFAFTPADQNGMDVFKTDGLTKNGSIARGISFGNNQDLTVNSNLNLQISGKLTEKIDVLAAVTDQNIPIQPDGNTQQLQQFDQVYIQLSDPNSKMIVGDYQLSRPKSYFMNYYKRAQGGTVSTNYKLGNKTSSPQMSTQASVAVSKGKFSRNVIQGIEGNQGPYRLKGAENETFIIVLSGTEKVYIDGQLQIRGQENDYVIDYNTSEITFTAKKLITKDRRIVVEFQYTDKNYARSLYQTANDLDFGKLQLHLNIYSEQDNKNRPLQQKLDDSDKHILAAAGDDPMQAIAINADSTGFQNGQIMYLKKDSIIGNYIYKDIYVFSVDRELAVFQVGFSNVGIGNGNYVQDLSGLNGKVFKWIAPLNGVKQGSYEPIVQLIAPKMRQMYVAAAEYALGTNTNLQVESALSNYDLNTFSSKDDRNNIDIANKLRLEHFFPLGGKDSSWKIRTAVNYEQMNKNFTAIERFRSVEFERDWNILNKPVQDNQFISGGELGLTGKKNGSINYIFNSFNEGAYYNATQNKLHTGMHHKGFTVNHTGSYTSSKASNQNTDFLRQKGTVSQRFKWITLSLKDEMEDNRFKDKSADTLLTNSYRFHEWFTTISNSDTTGNKISVYYTQRTDWKTTANNFLRTTFAEGAGFAIDLSKNPSSQLKVNTSYRKLSILNTFLTSQTPDNTILNRIEYNFRLLKSVITSSSYYEIGTGLEQKKEFSFIQVQAGQGNYTWNDYNENGIKELSEFEVAAFQDQANYIKVFTPTNIYVKSYSNAFNEILNITPAAIWNNKKGFKKFISRLSNTTAFRVDRKSSDKELEEAFNPFLRNPADSTLLSLNSSLRNTFYFNKSTSNIGFDYNIQDIRNKVLTVNGFDSRLNQSQGFRMRWNLNKYFTINCEYLTGIKSNRSEYLRNRNYRILYFETEPKISYQPNGNIRITAFYKYTDKSNHGEDLITTAYINRTGVETKYNILSKASLFAKVSYVDILFNGQSNSALAFEMLEALNPGKNMMWELSLQQNLSGNLQLSINYNGRKSETGKTIHIGGVQLRAFF